MGLFTGMYGIIALLVSLPAGVFAARIGEKRALLIGLAVTAVGLARSLAGHRYDVALAFRALWLVGYRTAFIGVFTAMAMVTPGRSIEAARWAFSAPWRRFASVIGAPFGTRVAAWLGLARRHPGLRRNRSVRRGRLRPALPSPAIAAVWPCRIARHSDYP